MTKQIFVVAYEGDEDSAKVLDYAITKAKRDDAKLIIAHVLEWSAYKFLTASEIEERHQRREEEMKRGQEIILAPALEKSKAAGIETEAHISYGNIVDTINNVAKEENADLILIGRSGGGLSRRVFGSATMGLVETSKVPLVIVP